MVRPGVTTRKPRVKLLAPRAADGVDGLPGDQHRHDGGFAGAGGELEREPHELGVRVGVGVGKVVEETFPLGASARPRSARWPSRRPRPGRRTAGCLN